MPKQMDHTAYQRAMRGKSNDELMFIIRDAQEAILAMPDGENAGYYQDEIHYAAAQLQKNKGQQPTYGGLVYKVIVPLAA